MIRDSFNQIIHTQELRRGPPPHDWVVIRRSVLTRLRWSVAGASLVDDRDSVARLAAFAVSNNMRQDAYRNLVRANAALRAAAANGAEQAPSPIQVTP